MIDLYIALVAIGAKAADEVDTAMASEILTPYVTELYKKTSDMSIGRWLMIEVWDQAVLKDVEELIRVRVHSR